MGLLDDILPGVVTTVLGVLDVPLVLKKTAREYDAASDSYSEDVLEQSVLTAPPSSPSFMELQGSVEKRYELKFFIQAENLKFIPEVDHRVIFAGKEYRIVEVEPVFAGEVVAGYTLKVKA